MRLFVNLALIVSLSQLVLGIDQFQPEQVHIAYGGK